MILPLEERKRKHRARRRRIMKKKDPRPSKTYKCKCGKRTLAHWSSVINRDYEIFLYKMRTCPKCFEKTDTPITVYHGTSTDVFQKATRKGEHLRGWWAFCDQSDIEINNNIATAFALDKNPSMAVVIEAEIPINQLQRKGSHFIPRDKSISPEYIVAWWDFDEDNNKWIRYTSWRGKQ